MRLADRPAQAVLRRGHRDEVDVIGHQAIGVNLPAGLGASLPQRRKEKFPVLIILEDGFPPVSAIHHVIYRAGILDSQLARHAPHPHPAKQICQYL